MSLTKRLLCLRPRLRILILFLAFFSALLGLAGPIFQKGFIDSLISMNGLNTEASFKQLIYFFACLVLSVAFQMWASYLGQREATQIQKELSHRLYEHTLNLKSDRMSGVQVGEVLSLYATDTAGSGALIELALANGAITVFPLLLAPFMLTHLLNVAVWPLLVTMAISLLLMLYLSWRQAKYFWQFKQLAAERSGLVNEWVQNIRALRSLGWVEFFEDKIFTKRIEETANRIEMVSNGQVMASMGASIGFFLNLAGVFALVKLRPEGALTAGELTATFWALGVYLARPLRGIPWILTFTLDSYTSIRRIERFLSLKSDSIRVHRGTTQAPLFEVTGLDLSIASKILLRNVSLKIERPEFVAIVGSVGSGKSLFVQSLVGEVPAQFASYHLLGRDVSKMSEDELKDYYAMVPQDGFIASTSIHNNVLLDYESDKEINSERVGEALRNAHLSLVDEGFIEEGHTVLGERGVNLSGGQRQRLGLARALFSNRNFLILDDSLSALDVNTEQLMIDGLFKTQLKDKIIFLVTHRHKILEHTDRVLFFKAGILAGNGSFAELMRTSTEFAEFVKNSRQSESHELN